MIKNKKTSCEPCGILGTVLYLFFLFFFFSIKTKLLSVAICSGAIIIQEKSKLQRSLEGHCKIDVL